MKLREEEGAEAHLIAYERSDRPGQRESRYRLVPVEKADELKAALASTLGIEVVVAKERRLFIWIGSKALVISSSSRQSPAAVPAAPKRGSRPCAKHSASKTPT